MSLLNFLILYTLINYCCCVVSYEADNSIVSDDSSDANAGIFRGFPQSLENNIYYYSNTAYDNYAKADTGVANSGIRTFFGGSSEINYSGFYQEDESGGNFAMSNSGPAVSGIQTVVNDIDDCSGMYKYGYSVNNFAQVQGPTTGSYPQAISGIQTQVGSIDDTYFYAYQGSVFNVARNKGSGNAISGIENSFGVVEDTAIVAINYADFNLGKAANGSATSGVKNTVTQAEDSTIYFANKAVGNVARGSGEPAVAGVGNTFGDVYGSFPGGGVFITTEDYAVDNFARNTNGGTAVSGVETQIQSAKRANIDLNQVAYGNRAGSKGYSTDPSDAVSGVQVIVGYLDASTLDIQANATDNIAINRNVDSQGSTGNDATSGVRVVVADAYDSNINVDAFSYDNNAKSLNGDAVAGNSVEVLAANPFSNIDVDSYADGNKATSRKGDAIIDNRVDITYTPYQCPQCP